MIQTAPIVALSPSLQAGVLTIAALGVLISWWRSGRTR